MTVVFYLFNFFVGVADFMLIKDNLILGGDYVEHVCLGLLLKSPTVIVMESILNFVLNICDRKVDKHLKC